MEKNNARKKDRGAEFVGLCSNYCSIIEKADKVQLSEFLDQASESLMAIYKYTFRITRLQTRYESDAQKFLAEKQYNKLRRSIMEILGSRDAYPEFLDPNRINNVVLFQSSISEDLVDIYQDLYDFINWHAEGTFEALNDSLIEVLTNFEKYWGIKLLNTLRAIHVIRYLKKDGVIFRDPADAEADEDLLDDEDDRDPDEFEDMIEEDR
jgi:hypothetical protein